MNISINSYQKPQFSFMAKSDALKIEKTAKTVEKVVSDIGDDITDTTLLALKANLKALKAKIGYETVRSVTMALKGNLKISELNDSKISNIKTIVDECISEIISKEELQSNPKLLVQVLKMKADTLQDIANMLTHKR